MHDRSGVLCRFFPLDMVFPLLFRTFNNSSVHALRGPVDYLATLTGTESQDFFMARFF
jgi:hypothetical protein